MNTAPPLARPARLALMVPFAIVTMIWGSTWLVIRGQLGVVPVSWSVTYRFLIGAAGMFVMARAMGASLHIRRQDYWFVAVAGFVTFVANYNLVYLAEGHVTSGVVAVTFSLLVVSNAILAWIFLRQPLSRPFLIGSAVAMLGVVLLFAHEWRAADRAPHDAIMGIGLTLVAVVSASIGNVMQAAQRARAMPMVTLTGWAMLCGAAIDAVYAWSVDGPPRFEASVIYVAGLLYLGIIASAVAFALYFNLIRQIGPARGGYVNVLVPVIAMTLSTIFEDYRWSAEALAGGVLVLVGLVLAMRARSPAR